MKKTLLLSIFLFSIFTTNAQQQPQTASVEKSIYGIQAGIFGAWVHNERKLSNSIALRTEIGLNYGLFGGIVYKSEINYILAPNITLEPRWYYNLSKRLSKERPIENNSGNFVGLKINYFPDAFVISNNDQVNVPNQLLIIPKWGIKRTIGKHFTYEVAIGIGYHHTFIPDNQYYEYEDEQELALDLHLRIGYTF